MSAKQKIADDESKYYFKTPQDMSRFEIAELEQMLKEIDEPEEFFPDEEIYASEEFKEMKEQMKLMQPIRNSMIRRYLEKYKYQKKKRDDIIRYLNSAEELPKEVLGEDYVHFLDAMPDIKQFLMEIQEKEKLLEKPKTEAEEEEEDEEEIDIAAIADDKTLSKKQKRRLKSLHKKKAMQAEEERDKALRALPEKEQKLAGEN